METNNETVEQVYDNLAEIGAHIRECPPLASVLTHHRFHGMKQIEEIGDEDWYFGVVDPCVLLFVCDRFLDAHKREIAEKDAEIASLRAIVKDLADVAERFVSCKATECETVCGVGAKCIHKKAISLITKAREVLNG